MMIPDATAIAAVEGCVAGRSGSTGRTLRLSCRGEAGRLTTMEETSE